MTDRYDWLLFDAEIMPLFDFHRCEGQALLLAGDIGLPFLRAILIFYREINIQCWQDYERHIITKDELRLKRFLLFRSG
ncbi:MAG: hypothetical protein R2824_23185 [Saprospiraceae bacterium]